MIFPNVKTFIVYIFFLILAVLILKYSITCCTKYRKLSYSTLISCITGHMAGLER